MTCFRYLLYIKRTAYSLIPIRFNHRSLGVGDSWKGKNTVGQFHRELPEGVKPTHIVVGAGSAGCVLVFLLFLKSFIFLIIVVKLI